MTRFYFLLLLTMVSALGASSQNEPITDTYYYEYSQVLFGTSIDSEGNLQGESTEFSLKGKPAEIVVMLLQDDPFRTSQAYVEIYNENSQLVESFELTINPAWNWFKFQIKLSTPGLYFLDIYNDVDVFINSGTVQILE